MKNFAVEHIFSNDGIKLRWKSPVAVCYEGLPPVSLHKVLQSHNVWIILNRFLFTDAFLYISSDQYFCIAELYAIRGSRMAAK